MVPKLPTNLPCQLGLKFMKAACDSGDLPRARNLFDKIGEPDLRTWTVLISAYTRRGLPKDSIKIYSLLRAREINPDKLVLLAVAKACSTLRDTIKAKEVYEDAIRFGFHSDTLLGNALIDMFAKCKCVEDARQVFDDIPVKDVVSWTSLTSCYVTCYLPRRGLDEFREMVLNRVRPNAVTVSSILPACSELRTLKLGREIHGFVVKHGMEENLFVCSALVSMYANCLSMRQAQLVFDNMSQRDIVLWNVILTAYFSNKECEKGLDLFYKMRYDGVQLNDASWNAVIGGCTQNGRTEQALEMLGQMQNSGFRPNQITITSVLPACSSFERLGTGKEIHGYIFRNWFIEDLTTITAVVFMYAKCGDLELSRKVFSLMPKKDTVAWNTIIIANSMHGKGEEALLLFQKMLDSGTKPNSVTFNGVLSGCSHSLLVDEGFLIFNSIRDYSIEPDADHYSCIVDILSRAGRLEEAYDFIQKMPLEPTAGAWGALLGACRVHKNMELAKIAANRLFEIEPNNPGNYVLLSNTFASAKLWDEASEIRNLMRDRGITKEPGYSWV